MADRGTAGLPSTATPVRAGSPYRLLGAAALALAVVAVASFPSPDPARAAPPRLVTAILTPDGQDAYAFRMLAGRIDIASPVTNRGSNLREALWLSDSPVEHNGTVCATWAAATSEVVQEGLALRIEAEAGNAVRTVTVTKNVTLGAHWLFNVHVFDSADGSFTPIGKVDLESTFALPGDPETAVPLPWRVCGRVVGSTVTVKAWRRAAPEPAWTDPRHAGSLELPAGAPTKGRFGWYIGHLHPGMTAAFTELGDRQGSVSAPVVAAADVAPDLAEAPAR